MFSVMLVLYFCWLLEVQLPILLLCINVCGLMGIATLQLGNREDAKELFKTSISINPNFANAYDNLGNLVINNEA